MDVTDWSAWDGALDGRRQAANDDEAGFGPARILRAVPCRR